MVLFIAAVCGCRLCNISTIIEVDLNGKGLSNLMILGKVTTLAKACDTSLGEKHWLRVRMRMGTNGSGIPGIHLGFHRVPGHTEMGPGR
jgi:hypothetical protein